MTAGKEPGKEPGKERDALWQTFRERRGRYPVRSKHRNAQGEPRYVNRLVREISPYLLQHAHNPVDWWPWGEPAFARARRENKPLLLSIGYSSCHWCHVMEEESFDDLEVAECLNRHFIAVKLDREMLPDVDSYYMNAAMLFTGRGGWPLNCLLTAQRKPFFAGAYYPKADFLRLLHGVSEYWQQRSAELRQRAEQAAQQLQGVLSAGAPGARPAPEECAQQAVAHLAREYDREHGGFGNAPKFPHESGLLLLLEQALAAQDETALEMAEHSLQKMAEGGIHDQIGGGFHRYATDRQWRIPHFEKMLYNQANLSRAYLRAWQMTGKEEYRAVVCACLDYVLRELRAPEHGFHSASDADSEGGEGAFFTWTEAQLGEVLGTGEDYDLARRFFAIRARGNFAGSNIPHTPVCCAQLAEAQGLSPDRLRQRLQGLREKLQAARARRPAPLRDDKIITAWNGMMVTALSGAGRLLQRPDYLQAASRAGRFLLRGQRRDDGQLWRVSLQTSRAAAGQQDDYAALAEACLQLYDDTGQRSWLDAAEQLCGQMLTLFRDPQQGDFFMRPNREDDREAPPGRVKDLEDHAVPSGNAMALRVLGKLAQRSIRQDWRQLARALADGCAGRLAKWPHAYCYTLLGMLELHRGERAGVQYFGDGQIRACIETRAGAETGNAQQLQLDIPEGWQVQAPSGQALLQPEAGWALEDLQLPAPNGEQGAWRDRLTIRFTLRRSRGAPPPPWPGQLTLRLAPCRGDACLPEEARTLLLPPAA